MWPCNGHNGPNLGPTAQSLPLSHQIDVGRSPSALSQRKRSHAQKPTPKMVATSPSANPRYAVHYISGTSAQAKLDSLLGEGPLLLAAEHWAAKALPKHIVEPGPTAGTLKVSEHLLDDTFLEMFVIAPDLKAAQNKPKMRFWCAYLLSQWGVARALSITEAATMRDEAAALGSLANAFACLSPAVNIALGGIASTIYNVTKRPSEMEQCLVCEIWMLFYS